MANIFPKEGTLTRYIATLKGKEYQVDFINPNLEETFFIGANGETIFEGTVAEFIALAHEVQECDLSSHEFHPLAQ